MAHDPFRDQLEGLRMQLRETQAFIEATERSFTSAFWDPLGAQLWLAPPSRWVEPPEDAGADVLMAAQLVAEKRAAALRDVLARWDEVEPLWTHAPRELQGKITLRLDSAYNQSAVAEARQWLRAALARALREPGELPAELPDEGVRLRERGAPLYAAISYQVEKIAGKYESSIFNVLVTTMAAGMPSFGVLSRGFFEGSLYTLGIGHGSDVGDEDFDVALRVEPSDGATRAVLDATLRKALVDLAATNSVVLKVDPPFARLELSSNLEVSVLRHALDVLVALHDSHAVPPLRR